MVYGLKHQHFTSHSLTPFIQKLDSFPLQIVWNAPILSTMPLNMSGYFHTISVALAWRTWSSTTTMLFTWSVSLILTKRIKTSWTVDMLVAGALIVGRYTTLSWRTSTSLRTDILKPVDPLTFCLASACSRTKTHRRFFLRAFSVAYWQVTSTNLLERGPQRSPAL